MNNCHTCKHNVYQAMREDDDPEGGMTNACLRLIVTEEMEVWIEKQEWDDEAMCSKVTAPCPGFKALA